MADLIDETPPTETPIDEGNQSHSRDSGADVSGEPQVENEDYGQWSQEQPATSEEPQQMGFDFGAPEPQADGDFTDPAPSGDPFASEVVDDGLDEEEREHLRQVAEEQEERRRQIAERAS